MNSCENNFSSESPEKFRTIDALEFGALSGASYPLVATPLLEAATDVRGGRIDFQHDFRRAPGAANC